MSMPSNILSPKRIANEVFTNAAAAVARLEDVYERNTRFLRERFEAYAKGEPFEARVRALAIPSAVGAMWPQVKSSAEAVSFVRGKIHEGLSELSKLEIVYDEKSA